MSSNSSTPRLKRKNSFDDSKLTKSSSLSSLFSLGKKRKRSEMDDGGMVEKSSPPNTPRSSISGIWTPKSAQSQVKRKKRSIFGLVRNDNDKGKGKDDGSNGSKSNDKLSKVNSNTTNNSTNSHSISYSDSNSDSDVNSNSNSDSESHSDSSHLSKKRRINPTEDDLKEKELDELLDPQYRKFRPRGFKFNPPPQDRPVRIYADGVFDLFHLGHMKQLEQAKKSLPNVTLICGIPSDKDTHKHKGLTVLTDSQRCETLLHCKWVDEVIPNAPWCVTVDFLKKHNIDYVAHDDLPYASDGNDDIYKPVKQLGMFLTTQRTEGISTSDIITKIIRDYDKYLMRNFARGATRKDLNVSWLKKNELDLKRHVNQFRESFKTNFESTTRDLYSEFMGYVSGALHLKEEAATAANLDPPGSPATDFASGYSGGSFFGNVKDWVSRRIDSSIPPSPSDTHNHSEED